ncbi:MAG: hypothetical protein H0W85_08410 [Methylotenera sp.]|nr:hypothetical protein [Methylotenera sp.]
MAGNVVPHPKLALSPSNPLIIQNTIILWTKLADQLIPIIGNDGFAMLYARSLFLARTKFEWLPAPQVLDPAASRFDALSDCLRKQSITKSSKGSEALLCSFIDILTLLIGEPLTTSILHAAWGDAAPVILARTFHHE